uniref:glycosyltransferase n=1 Tax=Anaerovibrio lipolyticus TaxID=82374 RepID=UPI0023F06291
QESQKEMELALSLYKDYDGLEPCLLAPEMIPLMEKRQKDMASLAAKREETTISACVIVKNEENNIVSWLENVKAFADEIIINDTGSEDDTKAIITRFSEDNPALNMVLVESRWQEDFSLAKNQCLAEATGEWIVFTDADELFATPEHIRGYLNTLNSSDKQIVLVPMANVDKDNNNSIINVFNVPRIFRREAGLAYVGRIHEEVTINGQGIEKLNTILAENCLFMEHSGYSTSISRKKAKRNLELLLKDVEEGQSVERLYQYLANSYYVLEDYSQALNNALLGTQSPYQPVGHQGDMYWMALNAMEKLEYGLEDRLAIAENGIKLFPELPDFYARKGMIQMEAGEYHHATKTFGVAVEKLDAYNNSGLYRESSNMMSILHMVYADCAYCLYKTGHSKEAVEKYQLALASNPWAETAICGWADIYQGRLDKGFLHELDSIYKELENSQEILAGIFAANGFPELAVYYGRKDKDLLIKEKSYETIYNKSMTEVAELLPSLYVCLLDDYNEEYVRILPDKLKTLVRYFHGRPVSGEIRECYSEYISFMKEIIDLGTWELLTKYLELLDIFADTPDEAEKHVIEVADSFLSNHKEKLALELYQKVPEDSPNVNEAFWQKKGICLFMVEQYEAALMCLKRAKKNKLIDTYIAWSQEAMVNGN